MVYQRNCELKSGVDFPEQMQRIAIGLEYAGSQLNGFQKQASTPNTVQEHLESALSLIADEVVTTVCAGRTDAGVHATGQVVHFDTLAKRPEKAWVLGVNANLPDEIRVTWAKNVSCRFHARFSAQARSYRYLFRCNRVRSAVLGKQVTHCAQVLNFKRMSEASTYLLGEHDFSSFRSSQCQANNPVRHIYSIQWCQQGELVGMEIKANAFLHHMVRNIVGTLMEVGLDKQPTHWVQDVLKAKNRSEAGPTAAPWGLYLTKVDYPSEFCLPLVDPGPAFFCWDEHSRF